MKKNAEQIGFLAVLVFLIFTFFSCSQEEVVCKDEIVYVGGDNPVNDNGKNLLRTECPLKKILLNEESAIDIQEMGSINTYHLSEKTEDAGFIDIRGFFSLLQSTKVFSECEDVFDSKKNTLVINFRDLHGFKQRAVVNWEENTIKVSTSAQFSFASDEKNDKVQEWPYYYPGGKEVVFDLGKYGFDILYIESGDEQSCLIPFYAGSSLFLSSVQIFIYFIDGVFYYDPSGYMQNLYSAEFFDEISEKSLPRYVIEESWNVLMFEMDYFYGLRSRKLGGPGRFFLDEDLTSYKNEYISDDKTTSTKGLLSFVFGYLDEGHSDVTHPSLYFAYSDYKSEVSVNGLLGSWLNNYISTSVGLTEKKKDKYDGGLYYSKSGKTAVINFDSFQFGDQSDPENPGTMAFYDDCMEKIKSSTTPVENIVIDLATNTGGSLLNMKYLVGMMTNKNVSCTLENVQDGTEITYEWRSDTNDDGKFDENDGYPNYNWYVLTSGVSFSCANFFPTIAKIMGLATVIGQKSGGGICEVRSTILPDGSRLQMSSSWLVKGNKINEEGKLEYLCSEDGIEPDEGFEISDDDFYRDGWADFLEEGFEKGSFSE